MKLLKRLPVAILAIGISCSDSSNDNPQTSLDDFKNENCSTKWTQEIIDRAVEACVETNNTVEDCTCSVENTAKEFTVCETENTENFPRMAEISLACGIQPLVE